MPTLITIEKSPKVITFNGNENVFKRGFKKKFNSPRISPKTRKIAQVCVKGIPKKFESGYILTVTPGTNADAIHKATVAEII